VRDPYEGVSASGMIATGVDRSRVPSSFEELLGEAVSRLTACGDEVDVYVYGSVATGTAVVGASDVDLLTIGASSTDAEEVAVTMSRRYEAACRGVEVAVAQRDDYDGETDEAYGNRVFLRHYCAHLAGPRSLQVAEDFPADARAARGFNGDIGRHLDQWRRDAAAGAPSTSLGRRLARKTLLAVAGLVSVADQTWTTDRDGAALRWAHLHSDLSADVTTLRSWSDGTQAATPAQIDTMLDRTIGTIVESFRADIGLWS
jgi:predicted nucleotidyltransferase